MKEDLQHLKQFVKDHPDNKMGWYLLGRQYEEAGKTSKANYCYAKAGEIFEAYEKKKLPHALEKEAEQLEASLTPTEPVDASVMGAEEGTESDAPDLVESKRSRLAIRLFRLAAIAMLLVAGVLYAPGTHVTVFHPAEQEASAPPVSEPSAGEKSAEQSSLAGVLYIGDGASEGDKQKAVGKLLLKPPKPGESYLLAEAPQTSDGKWIKWTASPRPLLEVKATASGAVETVYYEEATCACTPEEGADLAAKRAEAYLSPEIDRAVLQTAVSAYEKEKGQEPARAEDLVQQYPNNRLSGLTSTMKKQWPRVASASGGTGDEPKATSDSHPPNENPKPSPSPGSSKSKANPTYPLEQPLEIIVDRRNHRLAVVSGGVILRNYPVGLGGPRTPVGVFEISEKVKDPNGHSNGDFGSRGMTLSDTDYAIHGTNKPSSIGKDESLGCIRLTNEDVEELFDLAPMGTKVTITDGKLPNEVIRAKSRFHLPAQAKETNPAKVYHWLD
ncbi:L,D-transpeptidase family protein [Gorillibacterium sp. CAU 1737]|uniref:L,D-transpeptidase family protein n=1 Tax=Gorillibacterium sp. CAU 1737 TaxID=3140362 RepID=UPI003260DF3D